MAVGHEGDQKLVHDLVLADDELPQLGDYLLAAAGQRFKFGQAAGQGFGHGDPRCKV